LTLKRRIAALFRFNPFLEARKELSKRSIKHSFFYRNSLFNTSAILKLYVSVRDEKDLNRAVALSFLFPMLRPLWLLLGRETRCRALLLMVRV
jgi:hypothetical protein